MYNQNIDEVLATFAENIPVEETVTAMMVWLLMNNLIIIMHNHYHRVLQ